MDQAQGLTRALPAPSSSTPYPTSIGMPIGLPVDVAPLAFPHHDQGVESTSARSSSSDAMTSDRIVFRVRTVVLPACTRVLATVWLCLSSPSFHRTGHGASSISGVGDLETGVEPPAVPIPGLGPRCRRLRGGGTGGHAGDAAPRSPLSRAEGSRNEGNSLVFAECGKVHRSPGSASPSTFGYRARGRPSVWGSGGVNGI